MRAHKPLAMTACEQAHPHLEKYMQKNYALRDPRKHPDRVLDAVKHDVRQRIKRARGRALPEGQVWRFDCAVGLDAEHLKPVQESDLISAISALAANGAEQLVVALDAHAAPRGTGPAA